MNGAVGTKKLTLLWNVRLQVYFCGGQIHTCMAVHSHAGKALGMFSMSSKLMVLMQKNATIYNVSKNFKKYFMCEMKYF